jgi:hypothetical protein
MSDVICRQLGASVHDGPGREFDTQHERCRCSCSDAGGIPATAALAQRTQRPGADPGGAVGRGRRTDEGAWRQPGFTGASLEFKHLKRVTETTPRNDRTSINSKLPSGRRSIRPRSRIFPDPISIRTASAWLSGSSISVSPKWLARWGEIELRPGGLFLAELSYDPAQLMTT